MIRVKCTGDFNKTTEFLKRAQKLDVKSILDKYGRQGVIALSSATPQDTGKAAMSWGYEIKQGSNGSSITWTNSNIEGGIPVVVLIQYGHGTRNGGYVSGVDFINPAVKSIMDEIANEVWKEVTK